MLATSIRRTSLKKLHIITAILIFVWYILQFHVLKLVPQAKSTKYVNSDWTRFAIEQNGDYWIYNHFIISSSHDLIDNASITLTTHGTWRDIKRTGRLAARWKAPISMAVYVKNEELEYVYEQIYQIRYCTAYGASWNRWVSVQLVISAKYFPVNFNPFDPSYPRNFNCNRFTSMLNITAPVLSRPSGISLYPMNLLRNVARLNARTYYVFHLDPSMLPTLGFAKKFLHFISTFKIQNPLKSIYCIPAFQIMHAEVPINKSRLFEELHPFLNGTKCVSTINADRLSKLLSWILHPHSDGDISVYSISKVPDHCSVYISSNIHEPFYDQRYFDFSHYIDSTRLNNLVGLGYDFIVLDGTFVVLRKKAWEYPIILYRRIDEEVTRKRREQILRLNSMPWSTYEAFNMK